MVKKADISNPDHLSRFAPLMLILLPLLVYLTVVRMDIVYFDDDTLILNNAELLGKWSNIGKAFRTDAFFANVSPYYRPMMNVSFIIETVIGGGSVAFYHFSGLLLHILVVLCLHRLLKLLGLNPLTAFSGTMVFALHPVMGHAIMWIPARGDLLVTLFAILSFICFIRFLETRSSGLILLHIITYAGAAFSKESGVILPVAFVLFLFLKKEKLFDTRKFILYGGWLLTATLWYYLRYITIDHRPDNQRGLHSVIKNLPFIPESAANLFIPVNLQVTPSFSLFLTLTGSLIIITLVWLIYRNRKNRHIRLILFGMAWFLLFSAPNMFVRLSSANDNFEYLLHRIYLPAIGFLIALAALLPEGKVNWKNKTFTGILAGIVVVFIALDMIQKPLYKDAHSFWNASIQRAPGRSWFHYYYGRYYFRQKDFPAYEKALLRADSISSYPNFHYQLAMIYFTEYKDYEKAFRYFRSSFTKGYSDQEARDNFVLFCIESSLDLFRNQKIQEAIERVKLALDNDPDNAVAAFNMGIFLISSGSKEAAANMWKRSVASDPSLKDPYGSLALYYFHDRNLPDSARYYANKFRELGGSPELVSNIQ